MEGAEPGGVASWTVSSTGSNSFAGDVSVSLFGLPAGSATWTFTPSVIAGGPGTSQLDVTTATTIAPGTYPLTITGTSGTLTHTRRPAWSSRHRPTIRSSSR